MTSFGRVISVRGSLARVGLLAASQMASRKCRATVGRFVSIRCANSTIVAMITEVSCEDLPTSDDYIASASVDLLGEILGGPERPKFQRGVTNYPTIGDTVELITNQELRTVYAPTGSDQINVGTLQQDPVGHRLCRCRGDAVQAFRGARLDRRRQIERRVAAAQRNPEVAAEPAHLPARRSQRIRPLLRRPRAGAQSAQSETAVLAVQFRRDRRRAVRRPARRSRRTRHSRRSHSDGEGRSIPSTRTPTASD